METREQKIKNKVLDLFYINGNISVNIDDIINNCMPTIADKKFLITSIKNHQKDYNEVLSEIIKELEQQIKELEDGEDCRRRNEGNL